MYLARLTNEELAHHADVTFDELTATDLQVELTKRFTALIEEHGANASMVALLEEYGIDSRDALEKVTDKAASLDERVNGIALLDALREAEIDDPAELKKILDRDAKAEQIRELAQTASDALAELDTLFTPA